MQLFFFYQSTNEFRNFDKLWMFFFLYLLLGHGQWEGQWEGEGAEDEEVKEEKEGGKVDATCLQAGSIQLFSAKASPLI